MMTSLSQRETINALISKASWAWPQAVTEIFQPLGINTLIADSVRDIEQLLAGNRIHLAVLDAALDDATGMQAVRTIHNTRRPIPCILLANEVNRRVLAKALEMDVFSVVTKPVDMAILTRQIARLLDKYYSLDIASQSDWQRRFQQQLVAGKPSPSIVKRFRRIVRFTVRKDERSNRTDEN